MVVKKLITFMVSLLLLGCASIGGYYSYRIQETYPSPSTGTRNVIYYYPIQPYGLWWDFWFFYPYPDIVIINPSVPSPRTRRVR